MNELPLYLRNGLSEKKHGADDSTEYATFIKLKNKQYVF